MDDRPANHVHAGHGGSNRVASVLTQADWQRAVMMGTLGGGAFWAGAAQIVIASHAAPAAIVGIAIAATLAVGTGAALFKRCSTPRHQVGALGVLIAPLTGAATLAVFAAMGLLAHLAT